MTLFPTHRTLVFIPHLIRLPVDGLVEGWLEGLGYTGVAECVVAWEESGGAQGLEAEGAREGFANVVQFVLDFEACGDG